MLVSAYMLNGWSLAWKIKSSWSKRKSAEDSILLFWLEPKKLKIESSITQSM